MMLKLILPLMLAGGVAAQPAPTPTVAAGDTLLLGLEEAIAIALEGSHFARTLELNLAGSQYEVEAARGRFGTQARLAVTAPDLQERVQGETVPGELPRYDSYGSQEISADLTLSQPLPTDGALSLTGRIFHREDTVYDNATGADLEQRTMFNSIELSLDQPLLEPNGLKLGLERAEISHRLSRRAFLRGQLDLQYEVTSDFFALLRAQQEVVIARDALEQQSANYDIARRKFEAGLIPEVESLQMEVDLAEARNELLSRESDLALAADMFRLTIGLAMERPVRVLDDLAARPVEVDREQALRHALDHRTELDDQRDGIRRAEITLEETDARSQLRGELSAFYNLTGVSDPGLDDPGLRDLIDSSWSDLRRRPGNRGVRLGFSVPIWDSGVNEAEVASAEVALRRQELDGENLRRSIRRQVQAALARLEAAQRRLDVLERSMDVAGRGYAISQERFEMGEITSQTLADNRDRLVQARRSFLTALVNHRLAVADLRRQTLYDFEAQRSLVEDR